MLGASPAQMEEAYRALYVQCWDADADIRQSADDITELLQAWSEYLM